MATRKKRKSWDSYDDYLKSEEWDAIRKAVHKRDKGVCQLCGCPGASNPQCHHWTYPSDWNDDTQDNVVLSCDHCHAKLHSLGFEFNDADTYPAYLRNYVEYEAERQDHSQAMEADIERREVEDNFEEAVQVIAELVKSCRLGILENRLHVSGGVYFPEDKHYSIERIDCTISHHIGERLIDLLKDVENVSGE